jgi:hypothetical protein
VPKNCWYIGQYRAFLAAVRSSKLIIFCMAYIAMIVPAWYADIVGGFSQNMSKSVVVVSPCGNTDCFVHACMHHWHANDVHATSAACGRDGGDLLPGITFVPDHL